MTVKTSETVIPSSTVIAWGRQEISDTSVRALFDDHCMQDDPVGLRTEKELWKAILIEAGLYSLMKKRLDHIFRELTDSTKESVSEDGSEFSFQSTDDFLDQWLIRPHAGTYKKRFHQLSDQERIHMKHRALHDLSLHTHHPGAERTLYQLIVFHEEVERGVAHWYSHTITKSRFTSEDMQFLKFLSKRAPDTAAKLILQTVDMQAEVQKTNIHATIPPLLKQLIQCVEKQEADRLFSLFKSRFAHRRALLELIP